jgi:hypothetical protein
MMPAAADARRLLVAFAWAARWAARAIIDIGFAA